MKFCFVKCIQNRVIHVLVSHSVILTSSSLLVSFFLCSLTFFQRPFTFLSIPSPAYTPCRVFLSGLPWHVLTLFSRSRREVYGEGLERIPRAGHKDGGLTRVRQNSTKGQQDRDWGTKGFQARRNGIEL